MADYRGSEEYARYYRPYSRKSPQADDSRYLDLINRGTERNIDTLQNVGDANARSIRETGSIYAGIPEKVVDNFLKGGRYRAEMMRDESALGKTAQEMELARTKEERDSAKFAEEQYNYPAQREELAAKIANTTADSHVSEEQARKLRGDSDFLTPENRQKKLDSEIMENQAHARLLGSQSGLTSEETLGKKAAREDLDRPLNLAPQPKAQPAQIPLVISPERRKGMVDMRRAQMSEEQASPALPKSGSSQMAPPKTKREAIAQSKVQKERDAQEVQGLRVQKMKKDLAKVDDDKVKLTAAEAKQQGNANIGELAEQQYLDAVAKGKKDGSWNPTSNYEPLDNASRYVPNIMKSAASIEGQAAQSIWVETFLRDASGAAIPPGERPDYAKIYFPQPGESELVVANKKAARAQKMANARAGGHMPDAPKEKIKINGGEHNPSADDLDLRLEAARAKNRALKGHR
jgi:hypothetical protein